MVIANTAPVNVDLPPHGIYVFESSHKPNFTMPPTVYDYHKLCFVKSGKGRYVITNPEQKMDIRARQVLVIPMGINHYIEDMDKDPLNAFVICYTDDLKKTGSPACTSVQKVESLYASHPFITLFKPFHQKWLESVLQKMIFEQTLKNPEYETVLFSCFADIMATLVRIQSEYSGASSTFNREEAFKSSLSHLHEHFFENIAIPPLAEIAMMSYRSYTEYFKKHTGKTVNQYILDLKIDYAKQRLNETGSIHFSAFDAGFNNLSNFYRAFKKATGITPKEFLSQQG
jgi:AraC family L-rhamnose operon regulatory protein RhaS